MKHKVKTHSWVNGRLKTRTYVFKTAKEAEKFVDENEFYMAKLYNDKGQLTKTYDRQDGRRAPIIQEFYA